MFDLREYQTSAVSLAFKSMMKGNHPLIGAPTGSGKTVIMAGIIEYALEKWPGTKILILSHVKEILGQNHRSITKHLGREVGLFSAGLKSRVIKDVTVAGIQSVFRIGSQFSSFDLIIIDECHLIPLTGDGMYRTFFNDIGKIKYLGLTATPYRLGGGYIYGTDKLFTDMAIDLTSMEEFEKLIKDGYLCDLKVIATQLEFETRKLKIKAGDYSEVDMSKRFDRDGVTDAAVREIIKHGKDYKKWLIFAIDINHAEHIAEKLIQAGVKGYVVHSKMEDNRDEVVSNYRAGIYQAIVNVNILTTGFDDPGIDLIALLRPTKSPVMHVQSVGRGLRVSEGKTHCIVLDFAGNTRRLGPINNIHIDEPRKRDGKGSPITKTCPECDTIHHPAVRICPFCQYEFQFKHGLGDAAGYDIIQRRSNWKVVDDVVYAKHEKVNRPSTLKVTYRCGLQFYDEWVCVEHGGYAKYKADHWVTYRGGSPQMNVDETLGIVSTLITPARILIDHTSKYPLVIDYSF